MKLALLLLSLGAYSGAALAFITQVLLARALTLEEFGAFSATLSFITLVMPLAGFGVGMFWLKVFGGEGIGALRWIKPSVKFTLVSTVLVLIFIYLWAFGVNHSPLNKSLLLILSFYVLGQVAIELASSIYQLEERQISLSLWQFLPHALRFIMVFSLYYFYEAHFTAISAAYIYAVTAIIMLVVGGNTVLKVYKGDIALVGHNTSLSNLNFRLPPKASEVLSEAWPFGLIGVLYFIYFHSSIVLISYLLGDEEAAQYSVIITILTGIYMFPNLIYQKLLLPKIHRWANYNRSKLVDVYKKGNIFMLLMGAVIAGMVILLGPYAIPAIFGDKYNGVTSILFVIALSIPVRFVSTSSGSILATKENMITKTKCMGFLALINVLLTWFFIEAIGFIGAAYAVLLSDMFLLSAFYYFSYKAINSFNGKA